MFRALLLLLPILAARDPVNGSDGQELFKVGSISVQLRNTEGRVSSILLLNGIHRGGNFRPSGQQGDPALTREVIGYHHRLGPVGQVMAKWNWFTGPGGKNAYAADARMPASLVGLALPPLAGANLPAGALVGTWSEPPYATIGMYVGGMAAYARPYQHVHFFEMNPQIVNLSLPEAGSPVYFHFSLDARGRGAEVRVFTGNERTTLRNKGPRRFYRAVFVESSPRERLDDVRVELLNREGVASLFESLTPDGILCVHTSNRYVDLVPVLADVAESLKLSCQVGRAIGVITPPVT